ncbi:MAG: muconate cycloisomerase [Armatimonadetes bacterium]|nr:muconate cycloisomerase [Armatimonadota bacterium]
MGKDRIARVEVIPAALPVKTHEDSSRGEVQQHVFLRIETQDGAVGWGEARALPSWTGETLEGITTALSDYFAPVLLGASPFARNAIFNTIDEIVTGAVSNGMPAARSAVDIALHDLQGKLAGVAVHELLGGKTCDHLYLSHSLRAESPQAMREAAMRYHDSRCLKVKLTGDAGLDSERLAAVSDAAPQAAIWLDGNQNYSATSAMTMLDRIRSAKRCTCLQQPVGSNDWFGMARLRQRSWLPLAVDEGCFSPDDVLRIARLEVADLVVLKLCKAGGLRDLARQAVIAQAAGLDLLGSGLTESGIGMAAAVHVFSTLRLRLPPQLNGSQYLDEMLVSGLETTAKGAIRVPNGPGLGIEVDEERLRALAIDD